MKVIKQLAGLALAAGMGLLVSGCESKSTTAPSEPTLVTVSVAPATATLAPSSTQALTVTGSFSDSSTLDMTSAASFSTDNPAVATVSGAGVVTAVAPQTPKTAGVAHILASVGGKSATATITVTNAALVSIAIVPASVTLAAGGTQLLSVIGTYDEGSTATLTSGETFNSNHATVATVDSTGNVTAVGAGTATITATDTASGKSSTCVVTVTAAPVATLQSISAAPTSITLAAAGATQQLAVSGHYSNGNVLQLPPSSESFSSSSSGVATVSPGGLVTAVSTGTATITVIDNATGLVATPSPTVTVGGSGPTADGNVYSNGALDAGVAFAPFGGATNSPAPAPDATTLFTDGTPALKVVVTGATGAYSGGAWVASSPRDLRTFNAVTFWAKASQAQSTLKVQLGNDAGAGANVNYQVESIGLPLTTNWQQFVIPLPDPTQANGIDGLFSFADANNNYTFWLANVRYASVPANVLGSGTVAGDGLTGATPAVPVGDTSALPVGPNSIIWTLGTAQLNGSPVVPLPNGGNLDNDAWRWFALTSSNTAAATVNSDGVISGVAVGTASITGTLAGVAIPGSAAVTVSAPLATPTTNATTPSLGAANVIALYDSSGVYTAQPIANLNENWCDAGATEAPYAIPGGSTVLNYVLPNCTGIGFEGADAINASAAGMTSFHMDIWTPDPAAGMIIQLVDAASNSVGSYTPTLQANTWNSIDVPFSAFTGLTGEAAIQQIGIINNGIYTVLYIDNIYFHK